MKFDKVLTWIDKHYDWFEVAGAVSRLTLRANNGDQAAKLALSWAGYDGSDESLARCANFALWLSLCNDRVKDAGLSIFEMGDHMARFGWRDAYTRGASPAEAMRQAVSGDPVLSKVFAGARR